LPSINDIRSGKIALENFNISGLLNQALSETKHDKTVKNFLKTKRQNNQIAAKNLKILQNRLKLKQ
jgi:uncharacterized protein (DUF2164 family)